MHSNNSDRSVIEAFLETSETLIDVVTSSGVISDIPVVGTAIKLLNAKNSLQDKALFAKLSAFISPMSQRSNEEKERYRESLRQNPEEAKKVGENLFLVVDRLTDLDKPILLGQIFIAYLENQITSNELRRLAHAIDVAFSDDLFQLLAFQRAPKNSQELWMQQLAPVGLTAAVGGKTYSDVGEIFYEVTSFGHKLRNAYFHGRKVAE